MIKIHKFTAFLKLSMKSGLSLCQQVQNSYGSIFGIFVNTVVVLYFISVNKIYL